MKDIKFIIMDQLRFISEFGNYYPMVLISFIIVLTFLIHHKHYLTSFVTLLTSISYLYSAYLKELFAANRPLTASEMNFFILDRYSFPSSHVVFYTVFWGFIIYLTYKYSKEAKLLLNTVRWLAIYYIVLIGASRIALGMHFLRDVVAGYFFGSLFLILLIWLDNQVWQKSGKN